MSRWFERLPAVGRNVLFGVALMFGALDPCVSNASEADRSEQVSAHAIAPQAWQVRRDKTSHVFQQVRAGDRDAAAKLDVILTEFEKKPLERTPLENLEIIGVVYLAKDGVDAALPVIVMNQVLGSYDALRFGTESGRSEILENEGFFKRPFVLGGQGSIDQMKALMHDHPEDVAAKVNQGIAFALKNKDHPGYDIHWPTAYGLERMICAQGGSCAAPPTLPEDQWAAAWNAATQRVLKYYGVTATPSGRK